MPMFRLCFQKYTAARCSKVFRAMNDADNHLVSQECPAATARNVRPDREDNGQRLLCTQEVQRNRAIKMMSRAQC